MNDNKPMRATVDLVTGFLGAGKTTLIRDYAEYLKSRGRRVCIIENEFGMAGVDADVLKERGFDVSQLVGGCICCAQKVGFHDYLVKLSQEYERIIVEPSGIFNVDDFIDVINSPDVKEHCQPGAVITVVSAESLADMDEVSRGVLCLQLLQTGCVVLSHMEHCADAKDVLATLSTMLRETTGYERDFSGITLTKAASERDTADYEFISSQRLKPRVHVRKPNDHQALYNSTTIRVDSGDMQTLRAALASVLDGSYGNVLRLKGCVHLREGWFDVNCVPGSINVEPCSARDPDLNIIGRGIKRGAIRQLLQLA